MKNDTLKEYYVKLENLWSNAVNLLTAMNQSLHTNASEITVTLMDTDNIESTIRIPSFIYLENKLESLNNNFSSLFNMPNSGEAWFQNTENSNMYKLQMVQSCTAPVTPLFNTKNLVASLTDNNVLKDMVSPKTFLKLNVDNIPNNIEKIFIKKIIIFDDGTFGAVSKSINSYDEFTSSFYNLRKGVDYEEYDSIIDLPIKRDKYLSNFKIMNIPGENNPWINNINSSRYTYKLELDTLKYIDIEDSSIEFNLKVGDKLTLSDKLAIYKIKSVNQSTNTVEIEEEVGHVTLQTFEENSSMEFRLYNTDFSDYNYIQVPLEENPYLLIFIGSIQNNVRSYLSKPLFVNLNEIYMTDAGGNFILDNTGNKVTYIEYYNKYCTNIGDLILGLTETAYPQLTTLNNQQLESLQFDSVIKTEVDKTIDANEILKVVPLNKHVINNETTEEIISLHAQKNEILSKLNNINNSISVNSNKLITTDFSQDTTVTRQSLQSELTKYYNERIQTQQQLNMIVNNINSNLGLIEGKDIKYRIRGIAQTEELEKFISAEYGEKIQIIGIDVEYKYKSLNSDNISSITTINSNVFTDWNKLVTIDKQRLLKFNNSYSGFEFEFENYNSTNNIIKWNQIDIPIVADEDVVIRVRYKYNIGQPFVNLYTPWSNEITVVFPIEYKDKTQITTIISENQNDIIDSKFSSTLINDGYYEHITNSLIVNENKFYHLPENIYSGFTTSENNLISLKDKLLEMSQELATYKSWVESEMNSKYEVLLEYDGKLTQLFAGQTNKINIFNTEHIVDSFIKKEMKIIIKNTGEVPVKLYSIFPGNINTPLIMSTVDFYQNEIGNYERVPLIASNEITYQRLGQWIYFRQNNFWTKQDIYHNTKQQRYRDLESLTNNNSNVKWSSDMKTIMKQNNSQVLLGYRERSANSGFTTHMLWGGLSLINNGTELHFNEPIIDANLDSIDTLNNFYLTKNLEFFYYDSGDNNYLMRYEDIFYNNDGKRIFLDNSISLVEFISQNNVPGNFNDDTDLVGAFLFPDLPNINLILTNGELGDYYELGVAKTVSIPITLEYYLAGDILSITKSLYFDIQTSKMKPKENFMIEVNATYDYTASGNLIQNIILSDETTNI